MKIIDPKTQSEVASEFRNCNGLMKVLSSSEADPEPYLELEVLEPITTTRRYTKEGPIEMPRRDAFKKGEIIKTKLIKLTTHPSFPGETVYFIPSARLFLI